MSSSESGISSFGPNPPRLEVLRENDCWEDEMADVAKVVTIIGSSPESFAKAADAAVQEAAKTLRGISGAHVVSMSAVVEGDRIAQYRTTVDLAFAMGRPPAIRARAKAMSTAVRYWAIRSP